MHSAQRDIYLVPFPFSDLSGRKVRPAVIISDDEYNRHSSDRIVCGITSNIKLVPYTIYITRENLEEGTLYEKSAIKVDTIAKISENIFIKKIGKIKEDVFIKIQKELKTLFSL